MGLQYEVFVFLISKRALFFISVLKDIIFSTVILVCYRVINSAPIYVTLRIYGQNVVLCHVLYTINSVRYLRYQEYFTIPRKFPTTNKAINLLPVIHQRTYLILLMNVLISRWHPDPICYSAPSTQTMGPKRCKDFFVLIETIDNERCKDIV